MNKKYFRVLALTLAAVFLALTLAGCSSKGDGETTTDPSTTGTTDAPLVVEKYYDYADMDEYITLGKYKGVEFESAAHGFSEAEVLAEAKQFFLDIGDQYQDAPRMGVEQTPGKTTVEKGDVILFDYEGTVDGASETTLSNMKAEGADLEIGSGRFIPGFEDGVIGKPIGNKFDITVTFPEEYGSEELNGKEAVFTCTIHKIGSYTITDDLVTEVMGSEMTVAEFYEYLRHDEMAPSIDGSAIYDIAFGNAEILKLPEAEVAYYTEMLETEGKKMDEDETYSREEFLSSNGIDVPWDEYAVDYVDERVSHELFAYAIAAQEGLEVTSEDLASLADYYRQGYGLDETYTDEFLLTELFGGVREATIYMLREEVAQFIYQNAVDTGEA